MPEPITLCTLDGGPVEIGAGALAALRAGLQGDLLTPASPGYDEARTVWNGMIDRRPGLIALVTGTADVQRVVEFARQHRVLLAVFGAGHNIAGKAVCDEGIVISFARMRQVEVDPGARIARVEPGATLAEVDAATQAHGLAVPTGINSTTGIAGLTLGGGFGWLSRKHGLTVDSLRSAEVVTADGQVVRASADEHPDLFWGLRGGGGNFGVVTSFEFQLHPVGPEVLAGLIVHRFSDAPEVLRFYRDFAASAPDELSVWVVLRKAPPLPFLPEDAHGTEVVVLATVYAGDIAEGERALAPLRAFGSPLADVVGPQPFAGFQQAFDPLLTPGARNYWKSLDFAELSDDAIDTVIDLVGRLPGPHCEIFFGQLGGAAARVPEDSTAYRGRRAAYAMNAHGRWETPEEDTRVIGWCRDLFAAMEPFAMDEAYVNFLTEEESGRLQQAYGASWERLTDLKARWDPDNLFRMNQNIEPVRASA